MLIQSVAGRIPDKVTVNYAICLGTVDPGSQSVDPGSKIAWSKIACPVLSILISSPVVDFPAPEKFLCESLLYLATPGANTVLSRVSTSTYN